MTVDMGGYDPQPGQTFELQGSPGFLPHYEPPGLSVRATFLATDGSRPQELVMEWKHDPGQAVLDFALNAIMDMARPAEVEIVTGRSAARRMRPTEGPFDDVTGDGQPLPPQDVQSERGWAREPTGKAEPHSRPVCGATGEGHEGPHHGCTLPAGHDPVEPEGRQHRCRCHGIFSSYEEAPDVPGRAEQERLCRERER